MLYLERKQIIFCLYYILLNIHSDILYIKRVCASALQLIFLFIN